VDRAVWLIAACTSSWLRVANLCPVRQRQGIVQLCPQIDPIVPWCHGDSPDLPIALGSSNFGCTELLHRAFATS
jgi:hypothetical protein